MEHRIDPGLYSIGKPTSSSPVFVTGNYKLSFDALRTNLKGIDSYILLLDTKGVNVWCAAGKGTFGTEELVGKIESSGLKDVVSHRELILPQLGAPGVAAHEVKKRTGFNVVYSPVRASDISEFMKNGKNADDTMRRVDFPLKDRLALIPVELKNYLLYALIFAVVGLVLAGPIGIGLVLMIYFAGLVIFPALFPYLPTKDFTTKGMFVGLLASVPFIAITACLWKGSSLIEVLALDISMLLYCVAAVGYFGMNWTGCTPYPSRTGVRREIFRYIPPIAAMMVVATVLAAIAGLTEVEAWF